MRGLPDTSLTSALFQGGREFYGWGQDRHLYADIYDALIFNTRATGHWKKSPEIPNWPRPTSKKNESKKSKASVKDLWAAFNRR